MGKNIQDNLMKKIIRQSTKKIYIAMDGDALDYAMKYCQGFLDEGKKVYLINLTDEDPNDMGFYKFNKLLRHAKQLTYKDMMLMKLNKI